jgi:hypothetical protein
VTFESVLDVAIWVVPILVVTAFPLYERLALRLGWDGERAFVEQDGRLLLRAYVRLAKSSPDTPWSTRALRQLGRDLTSPFSVLIILFIAATIVVGVTTRNAGRAGFGVLLACGYAWLFASTVKNTAHEGELFEGTVEALKPPVFLSYGMATVKLDDGRTIQTGVAWRQVEARRRRGPVRVVFSGTPESPMFAGIRAR